MYDLLKENGADDINIFGGGGGTILPNEIQALHEYGITRIYTPDDGRSMGLQGMINDLVAQCDRPTGKMPANSLNGTIESLQNKDQQAIARIISASENFPNESAEILQQVKRLVKSTPPVLGVTGTGGSGKSSLVDEVVRRFLVDFEDRTDRKSTRLNSSHTDISRMPSSA